MLLMLLLSAPTGPSLVFAETYVAGEVGLVLPFKNGSNAEVSGGNFGSGTPISDSVFKNSVLGGGRIGHYFQSMPWFGVSTEAYYSTPNLAQQFVTTSPPGAAPNQIVQLPGQSMKTVAWTNNFEFRMPGGKFEPYGGVGLAVMFAKLHDGTTGVSRSSTSPGLNVFAGGRYRMGEHFSFFGEWKYIYVPLDFDSSQGLAGLSTNFAAFNFLCGVGYHF
jgi:hypothetical protein